MILLANITNNKQNNMKPAPTPPILESNAPLPSQPAPLPSVTSLTTPSQSTAQDPYLSPQTAPVSTTISLAIPSQSAAQDSHPGSPTPPATATFPCGKISTERLNTTIFHTVTDIFDQVWFQGRRCRREGDAVYYLTPQASHREDVPSLLNDEALHVLVEAHQVQSVIKLPKYHANKTSHLHWKAEALHVLAEACQVDTLFKVEIIQHGSLCYQSKSMRLEEILGET